MAAEKTNEQILAGHLIDLINKGNAHASLDEALKDIPFELLGEQPGNLPYSIYQLAWHIRITQRDLLEFSRNEHYTSPKWPEGYWPKEIKPASKEEWEKCVKDIKSDRKEFTDMISANEENLYKKFSYGSGQTLLKEALVLADHNAYHTGEIIVIRRLLNNWKN